MVKGVSLPKMSLSCIPVRAFMAPGSLGASSSLVLCSMIQGLEESERLVEIWTAKTERISDLSNAFGPKSIRFFMLVE